MVSCVACGTSHGAATKRGVTFHKFPKNSDKRKAWLKFLNADESILSKNPVLCSQHFRENDMDRTSKSVVRLKSDAVPNIIILRPKYARVACDQKSIEVDDAQNSDDPVEVENDNTLTAELEGKESRALKEKVVALAEQLKYKNHQVRKLQKSNWVQKQKIIELRKVLGELEKDEGEVEDDLDTEESNTRGPKITSLCRICARYSRNTMNIFSEEAQQYDILNKIHTYLPIRVTDEDILPLNTCFYCVKKLDMCNDFVKRCLEADSKLKQTLGLPADNDYFDEVNVLEPGFSDIVIKPEVVELENSDCEVLEDIEECLEKSVDNVEVLIPNEVAKNNAETDRIDENIVKNNSIEVISGLSKEVPQQRSLLKPQVIKQNQAVIAGQKKSGKKAPEIILVNTNEDENCEVKEKLQRPATGRNSSSTSKITTIESSDEQDESLGGIMYHCVYCGLSFSGNNQLISHQIAIHSDRVFACTLCRPRLVFYKSKHLYNRHMFECHLKHEIDDPVILETYEYLSKPDPHLEQETLWHDGFLENNNGEYAAKTVRGKSYASDKVKDGKNFIKTYPCSICKKKFINRRHLAAHKWNIHKTNSPSICEFCGKTFRRKLGLIKHLDIHKNGSFICAECNREFKTKAEIKEHVRSHEERFYLCDKCGKSFNSARFYYAHKATHMKAPSINSLLCETCGKSFKRKYHLQEHINGHKKERPFKCHVCPKVFGRRHLLKQHSLIHMDVPKYECSVCDKRFRRRDHLILHSKTHERANFTVEERQIARKRNRKVDPQKCDVCGKVYVNKISLYSHMRLHTTGKTEECNFCGKRFLYKAKLDVHIRTHTGEKPFRCSYCSESYASKANLVIHERIHTGEKPFKCNICDKGFRSQSWLLQHKLVHSNNRRFACTKCDKRFKRQDALESHIRIHTGERPFACGLCGRKFKQQGDRNKHERGHAFQSRKFMQRNPYIIKYTNVTCSFCNERFASRDLLNNHIVTVHEKNEPVILCAETVVIDTADMIIPQIEVTVEQEPEPMQQEPHLIEQDFELLQGRRERREPELLEKDQEFLEVEPELLPEDEKFLQEPPFLHKDMDFFLQHNPVSVKENYTKIN